MRQGRKTLHYQIVGPPEANVAEGRISNRIAHRRRPPGALQRRRGRDRGSQWPRQAEGARHRLTRGATVIAGEGRRPAALAVTRTGTRQGWTRNRARRKRKPPPRGTVAEILRAQRIERAEQLREANLDPYPPRVDRTHTAAEVDALLEGVGDGEEPEMEPVAIVGRVVAQRGMGRASFLDVLDGSGRLQVLLRRNVIGDEAYERLKLLDLGDFVAVEGRPMRTRTGGGDRGGYLVAADHEGAAGPAGEVPRPHGRGGTPTPAVPRSARERGGARHVPDAQPDRGGCPPEPGRAGLPGGGDAGTAGGGGGRGGAAVRDALARAGGGPRPAHQPRTAPEAAAGGRVRARLRTGAHLPQRRLQPAPQPRVHDGRALPGVRRLRHDGLAPGGARERRGEGGAGDDDRDLQRERDRLQPALAAHHFPRRAARVRRLRPGRVRGRRCAAGGAAPARAGRSRGGWLREAERHRRQQIWWSHT